MPRSASWPHLALPGVHAALRAAIHPFSICPPVGADPAAGGESPVHCGGGHLGDALPRGPQLLPSALTLVTPQGWSQCQGGYGGPKLFLSAVSQRVL